MTLYIVSVVEGQTEQRCVECLLHRVWQELLGQAERLQVLEPFRGQRDQLMQPGGQVLKDTLRKAMVNLQLKSRRDSHARRLLLILLDAEGDCPANRAPGLLEVAREVVPVEVSVACVLARRMLENWIVAGASSLAGVNGLPDPLPARDKFEDRSGVTWLDELLRSRNTTRKYKKTVDAKEFIRLMALQECRDNAPSFDKLCRELEALLPPFPESAEPANPLPTS